MNQTKKIIQINPELFNQSTKKEKVKTKPLISPNIIKNKFLKRIKEHKLKEIERSQKKGLNNENDASTSKYSDEFNDSIEYLQNISNQQKMKPENILKQREKLENKTLKHYNTPVNIDLPDDLKEDFVKMENIPLQSEKHYPMQLNYSSNDVPYGILKRGNKPTYREWNKTRKMEPQPILNEREERLRILREKIRQKQLSVKPDFTSTQIPAQAPIQTLTQPLAEIPMHVPVQTLTQPLAEIPMHVPAQTQMHVPAQTQMHVPVETQMHVPAQTQMHVPGQTQMHVPAQTQMHVPAQTQMHVPAQTQTHVPAQTQMHVPGQTQMHIPITSWPQANPHARQIVEPVTLESQPKKSFMKRITKKTSKHKYTLGKSKIKKMVTVLLKNQNTRKKILHAQKEIKQHPMVDIKKYLKKHNLIKIGSHAPNDVVRKLYESAVLAGDINNSNTEMMLHNFIKDSE